MTYDKTFLEPFLDGLKEMVPQKTAEILNEMNGLIESRTSILDALRKVRMQEGPDEIRDYIVTLYAELEYARYESLRKELLKWLQIAEKTGEISPREEKENTPAKFSAEEIDRAKTVPIENFYEGDLRGSSRLMGKCPFHEEKTGSFVIFTNTNTYYCFGCHVHGDVIDFLMRLKNITFRDAVRELL